MQFDKSRDTCISKGIQNVLIERSLWLASSLNLECPKPKFYNCQVMINCKLCVKGKKKKDDNAICGSSCKCDACVT